MGADGEATFELALDGGFFVHEEHHDVNGGVAEMDAQGRVVKLAAQGVHAIHEELETLDLHLGAGEAIEDDAVAVNGIDEAAEEQAHDLAVADHVAGVFDGAGLGRIEQSADDDGLAGETAGAIDEGGVGAFAGAGSAAEEDDLLGEAELVAAVVALKFAPNGVEDNLGVLNLEVVVAGGSFACDRGDRGRGGRGGGGGV